MLDFGIDAANGVSIMAKQVAPLLPPIRPSVLSPIINGQRVTDVLVPGLGLAAPALFRRRPIGHVADGADFHGAELRPAEDDGDADDELTMMSAMSLL